MNILKLLVLIFFTLNVNGQIINLKVYDYSNNHPIQDADVYFKNSTKNFVSNLEGKVVVDLSNVSQTDELIVSKKDYQDAVINVSELKSERMVKLEKVSEIELKEVFVTTLKTEDILQKVYDDYDKNFNVEEYYFLVNFQQNLLYNKKDRDFIEADLQFKFKRGDLKIKSNGIVNKEIKSGREPDSNIRLIFYLQSIYLKEKYIKTILNIIKEKKYEEVNLTLTKYGDNYVYEIFIKSKSKEYHFTIDKKTFAVVEFYWNMKGSDMKLNEGERLTEANVVYKYRPHKGNWVLKETSAIWNTEYNKEEINNFLDMNFNIIVNDYSIRPFPNFNKSVNEKMDIRRSFK